jgi:hypothetical protein
MVDYQDTTNVDSKGLALTIRSVFIIDPAKKVRLIMTYPASTGRNTAGKFCLFYLPLPGGTWMEYRNNSLI